MDLKTVSDLIPMARTDGDALVVSVRGEIDLHNSPEFRTELLDLVVKHPSKRLILNLSQVPYMDSSACAVLLEALRRVRAVAGKMYLAAVQPRVKSLLEIARLETIFILVPDEADALKK